MTCQFNNTVYRFIFVFNTIYSYRIYLLNIYILYIQDKIHTCTVSSKLYPTGIYVYDSTWLRMSKRIFGRAYTVVNKIVIIFRLY